MERYDHPHPFVFAVDMVNKSTPNLGRHSYYRLLAFSEEEARNHLADLIALSPEWNLSKMVLRKDMDEWGPTVVGVFEKQFKEDMGISHHAG